MAYGDAVATIPETDKGYTYNNTIRVSNPVSCGSGVDQGGTYFPPGQDPGTGSGLIKPYDMQFKIGASSGTLNGGSIPVPIHNGDSSLVLTYTNILKDSITISVDGSDVAYGSFGSERFGYTVTWTGTAATITFTPNVVTDQFYIIKFIQQL